MLALPLLVLLASARGGPAAGLALTARTLFPCYSADLKPASEVLVSASGCTVLFSVEPPAAGTTASWEYESGPRKAVIATYVPNKSAEISGIYEGRVSFNEMDFSLQMVLRWWDGGLYRFRSESEATGWFELRVVEPLSEPEILGNSLVEVGGDTKLFCNVLEGQVDLYWWKRNGELLMESNGLHFVHNNTLEIHRALMNDTGYYTCIVSNAVSQNETSFLLRVHSNDKAFLPIILVFVSIGLLAGIFVWCRLRSSRDDRSR
ncbi:HEPACAM family member 2-like [Cygnus atratus]|uniref:HEPACAM family member 2-like n=1 Tax=Cygnus atratus TaxID=8868 RepID=UPI0015D61DCC|nr:HEPACAM family member 2-like [Cygnus atratus]